MPRLLTPDEVSLIHRLLPETTERSERLLKDLALAQVEDVEVVGFGGVVFLSSTTNSSEVTLPRPCSPMPTVCR
ncbi:MULTISPECIES: hypothetical protein [unclassified Stenotrophomonas]|uniref:hypothetical protein n=1 Tax=unclassified Stenotrophomonas TaxID=196198 RepID=UPI001F534DEB|nr:hypothetical protein [Stenotrophomonas maltophilia]